MMLKTRTAAETLADTGSGSYETVLALLHSGPQSVSALSAALYGDGELWNRRRTQWVLRELRKTRNSVELMSPGSGVWRLRP